DTYTVDMNKTLKVTSPGILANDSDASDIKLTAIKVSGPEHGSLTLNKDGSFTYIPDCDFFGTDTFTYKANDGTFNSNTVTVTIIVHAPVVAKNDSYNLVQNNQIIVNAANGLLANDQANGNTLLTAVLVSGPSKGILSL